MKISLHHARKLLQDASYASAQLCTLTEHSTQNAEVFKVLFARYISITNAVLTLQDMIYKITSTNNIPSYELLLEVLYNRKNLVQRLLYSDLNVAVITELQSLFMEITQQITAIEDKMRVVENETTLVLGDVELAVLRNEHLI